MIWFTEEQLWELLGPDLISACGDDDDEEQHVRAVDVATGLSQVYEVFTEHQVCMLRSFLAPLAGRSYAQLTSAERNWCTLEEYDALRVRLFGRP